MGLDWQSKGDHWWAVNDWEAGVFVRVRRGPQGATTNGRYWPRIVVRDRVLVRSVIDGSDGGQGEDSPGFLSRRDAMQFCEEQVALHAAEGVKA